MKGGGVWKGWGKEGGGGKREKSRNSNITRSMQFALGTILLAVLENRGQI